VVVSGREGCLKKKISGTLMSSGGEESLGGLERGLGKTNETEARGGIGDQLKLRAKQVLTGDCQLGKGRAEEPNLPFGIKERLRV